MEKIYLGNHKINGATYLTKHSWDCEWYWGFGYIGNNKIHWHIESIIRKGGHGEDWTSINYHFSETWLNQKQWWILRDLFIQAYAFKDAARSYRHGGHQISEAGPHRVINEERAKMLNEDLKQVLDNIWTLLNHWKDDYDNRRSSKSSAYNQRVESI